MGKGWVKMHPIYILYNYIYYTNPPFPGLWSGVGTGVVLHLYYTRYTFSFPSLRGVCIRAPEALTAAFQAQ